MVVQYQSTTSSYANASQYTAEPPFAGMLSDFYPDIFDELQRIHGELEQTGSPMILTSFLPISYITYTNFPRFKVIVLEDVMPTCAEVVLTASTRSNPSVQLRNNTAFVRDNVATFDKLQFTEASETELFTLTITFRASRLSMWSVPVQTTTYKHPIKIYPCGFPENEDADWQCCEFCSLFLLSIVE